MTGAARILALVLALAAPAGAEGFARTGVTEGEKLTFVRPDYPVPRDPGQQFYLQRSTNANTIVYAARFTAEGQLDRKRPVSVYWRRYAEKGQVKPLKLVERQFAYGVNVRPRRTDDGFTVWLKPLPEIPMLLRQTGPGKAELLATIGGKLARPVYGYFEVDESGLIPRITEFSLHGHVVATGRAISETFRVTGGEIRQ